MRTAISTRHSITFRMTVAVCTLLLIFQVVLAILAFYYFKRELKHTISAQQLSLLTVVAQNIDQKLGSSSNVITDVARRFPAEAVKDSNAAQRFLDDRPGTLSHFDNGIYLFSTKGKIIAESPFLPGRRGRDISFREYYKQMMATGQPGISDPFISTHTPDTPTVMFTAPVRDRNGKLIAILGGGVNLLADNFLGNLSQVQVAETGYLFLTTSDRTIIMHPDKSKILRGTTNSQLGRTLAKALGGFAGTEETVNSGGTRFLTSFKGLTRVNWIVGVNYPAMEAYAPIWHIQKYYLLIFIVGTALFIIAIRIMMKRFTSTLVRFADHVRQISTKKGKERLFTEDSSDEVGILAKTFNEMVQNVDQKNDILLHVSSHDALTGLYNRSYFDRELERLGRGRIVPISIVMADIDGLKKCNDTAGHAAGDALIKSAARLLMEIFRAEDIVARIGGDEFGILLPGLDREHAETAVERVRNAVLELRLEEECYPLSISLGCAVTETPQGLEAAFKKADKRMYQDKMARKQKTMETKDRTLLNT